MLTREQLKPLAEAAVRCAREFGCTPVSVWMLWTDALGLRDSLV